VLRDLRVVVDRYQGFWAFNNTANYVRVVELGTLETRRGNAVAKAGKEKGIVRAPVAISAVPINVGPLLWERMWSRLDTAICTSATLTVYGQGFDFFLSRVGLEYERVGGAGRSKTVATRELPLDDHAERRRREQQFGNVQRPGDEHPLAGRPDGATVRRRGDRPRRDRRQREDRQR